MLPIKEKLTVKSLVTLLIKPTSLNSLAYTLVHIDVVMNIVEHQPHQTQYFLVANLNSWTSTKQRSVAWLYAKERYMEVETRSKNYGSLKDSMRKYKINLFMLNFVFHSMMKHISIDYHFVREQVQFRALSVSHVSTKDQLSDILTTSNNKTIQRSHA